MMTKTGHIPYNLIALLYIFNVCVISDAIG